MRKIFNYVRRKEMNLKIKVFILFSMLLLVGVLSVCFFFLDKEIVIIINLMILFISMYIVIDMFGYKVDILNVFKWIIGSYLEDYLIFLGEKFIV